MLIWIDVETTGLDPHNDYLLEVGAVATDRELAVIDSWCALISYHHDVRSANEYVQEMHEKSGLWEALKKGPCLSLMTAETELSAWIERHVGQEKPPLCGNNVPFDRAFLRGNMPKVLELLHYRNIDISTLKEVSRRFGPGVFEKPDDLPHRPLEDLELSIAEFRFYLEKMGWMP